MFYVASPSGTSFAPAHVAIGSVLCRRQPNVYIIFIVSHLILKRQEVSGVQLLLVCNFMAQELVEIIHEYFMLSQMWPREKAGPVHG